MDGRDTSNSLGEKTHVVTFNWGYIYPIELIFPFTFSFKRPYAYTSNLVTSPTVLATSFSIKSLLEELFLISVSLLLSLVHIVRLSSLVV